MIDQWLVGQRIVGVISFQNIYGLYSLKHHIAEKMLDVTLCDNGQRTADNGRNVKTELEFWILNSQ